MEQLKRFNAIILSPYVKKLDRKPHLSRCGRFLSIQSMSTFSNSTFKGGVAHHAFDIKRDFNYSNLISDKGRKIVRLEPEGLGIFGQFLYESEIERIPYLGDLIFVGSTEGSERGVRIMSKNRTPIVRYSKFYGGKSGYTGRTPEEGGYSFDMPKDVEYIKELLENDSFLEAILERSPERVRASLEKLNERLAKPIIATPFLERALMKD